MVRAHVAAAAQAGGHSYVGWKHGRRTALGKLFGVVRDLVRLEIGLALWRPFGCASDGARPRRPFDGGRTRRPFDGGRPRRRAGYLPAATTGEKAWRSSTNRSRLTEAVKTMMEENKIDYTKVERRTQGFLNIT